MKIEVPMPPKVTELELRIAVCKSIVEALKQMTDDPRQPDALAHYQAQLLHLESKRPGPPKDIVIGLKTATLTAKPQGIGE